LIRESPGKDSGSVKIPPPRQLPAMPKGSGQADQAKAEDVGRHACGSRRFRRNCETLRSLRHELMLGSLTQSKQPELRPLGKRRHRRQFGRARVGTPNWCHRKVTCTPFVSFFACCHAAQSGPSGGASDWGVLVELLSRTGHQ